MNHKDTRFTVIGAGHGGKAMAAHLALMGFSTTLFNRTPERVAALYERGGIDLESEQGNPRGFARLRAVTSDYAEALADAEVIMVVTPSSAHRDVAKSCAPYLKDGQIVVLNPGRTCGAIEFTQVLRDSGCTADVTVAEAGTFIYASRRWPRPGAHLPYQGGGPTSRPAGHTHLIRARGPAARLPPVH